MSKDYIAHWIIGIICTLVWFWGDLVNIPAAAITLAASIVPGLLGHALGYSGAQSNIKQSIGAQNDIGTPQQETQK